MSASDENMIDEIEESQLWLSQFDTPLPSAAAIERTKRAVRQELHGHSSSHQTLKMRHAWRPWQGALASAAAIGLAVLIGYSQMDSRRTQIAVAPIPAVAPVHESDLTAYTALDSELSELESTDLEHGTLVDAWDEIWTISNASGNQPG